MNETLHRQAQSCALGGTHCAANSARIMWPNYKMKTDPIPVPNARAITLHGGGGGMVDADDDDDAVTTRRIDTNAAARVLLLHFPIFHSHNNISQNVGLLCVFGDAKRVTWHKGACAQ